MSPRTTATSRASSAARSRSAPCGTVAPAAPPDTPLPLAQTAFSLNAIDPRTGETRFKLMQDVKTWGVLATAGGIVFGGNQLGDAFAVDARTLNTLWTFNVGTAIQAPPMTFAVGGRQYIAIMAGGAAACPARPAQFHGLLHAVELRVLLRAIIGRMKIGPTLALLGSLSLAAPASANHEPDYAERVRYCAQLGRTRWSESIITFRDSVSVATEHSGREPAAADQRIAEARGCHHRRRRTHVRQPERTA